MTPLNRAMIALERASSVEQIEAVLGVKGKNYTNERIFRVFLDKYEHEDPVITDLAKRNITKVLNYPNSAKSSRTSSSENVDLSDATKNLLELLDKEKQEIIQTAMENDAHPESLLKAFVPNHTELKVDLFKELLSELKAVHAESRLHFANQWVQETTLFEALKGLKEETLKQLKEDLAPVAYREEILTQLIQYQEIGDAAILKLANALSSTSQPLQRFAAEWKNQYKQLNSGYWGYLIAQYPTEESVSKTLNEREAL